MEKIIGIKTVGQLITEAIYLHELNPDTVEKVLKLQTGTLAKLMSDDFYTNNVPLVLFRNLILSLHIPIDEVEAAMLPTFNLVKSKETNESLSKKPKNYMLWECEESVLKYTNSLHQLLIK